MKYIFEMPERITCTKGIAHQIETFGRANRDLPHGAEIILGNNGNAFHIQSFAGSRSEALKLIKENFANWCANHCNGNCPPET